MTSALAIGKLFLITRRRCMANHLSGTSFVITKKVRTTELLSASGEFYRCFSAAQRHVLHLALGMTLIHLLGIDSSRRTTWF
jgi:hypothetical protein